MAFKMGRRIGEFQRAHIEPGEAGGFHRSGLDPGKGGHRGLHLRVILPKLGEKALAPGFSVAIGRLGRGVGQGAHAGYKAALGFSEAAPERSVGNDGEGAGKAGILKVFVGAMRVMVRAARASLS